MNGKPKTELKVDFSDFKKVLEELENGEKDCKKEEKKKKVEFICPVCGHKKYKTILENAMFIPLGGKIPIEEIECENCHIRLGIDALKISE